MKNFLRHPHNRTIRWYLVLTLIVLFVLQLFASYFMIEKASRIEIGNSLTEFIAQVKGDVIYRNGTWDLSKYNSDPAMPYPNTPNPFPLYIITKEGYVIERSRPIKGLLDASDFKHLSAFADTHDLTSPTNEKWRVLAVPITRDGMTVGVAGAAYYNPSPRITSEVDTKLQSTLEYIVSHIRFNKTGVVTKEVDIRNIPYDVSFEVVDTYNHVLLNNGRMPSFIDPSYFSDELQHLGNRTVKDQSTGEEFLMHTAVITDGRQQPVSIVVAAKSIGSLNTVMKDFLYYMIIIDLAFIALFGLILAKIIDRTLHLWAEHGGEQRTEDRPGLISFDAGRSEIQIDSKTVDIPLASNQFYMTKALFSTPGKRWPQEDLTSQFPTDTSSFNARTLYDTMLAINKKTGIKLVIYKDKLYSINPEYTPSIAQA